MKPWMPLFRLPTQLVGASAGGERSEREEEKETREEARASHGLKISVNLGDFRYDKNHGDEILRAKKEEPQMDSFASSLG